MQEINEFLILIDQYLGSSISDAGVACLCVHTAIHGAYLNVIINIKDLDDDRGIGLEAKNILSQSKKEKENIIKFIQGKI